MPSREQSSLVFQEYEDRLEKAMEARLHLFQFLFFTNLIIFRRSQRGCYLIWMKTHV